jgi:hypothetical protein
LINILLKLTSHKLNRYRSFSPQVTDVNAPQRS